MRFSREIRPQYILEHGLDKQIGLGRVFRIAHESTQPLAVREVGAPVLGRNT